MPRGQAQRLRSASQWMAGETRRVVSPFEEMELFHIRMDPRLLSRTVGVDVNVVPALQESRDLVHHEGLGDGGKMSDDKSDFHWLAGLRPAQRRDSVIGRPSAFQCKV